MSSQSLIQNTIDTKKNKPKIHFLAFSSNAGIVSPVDLLQRRRSPPAGRILSDCHTHKSKNDQFLAENAGFRRPDQTGKQVRRTGSGVGLELISYSADQIASLAGHSGSLSEFIGDKNFFWPDDSDLTERPANLALHHTIEGRKA